MKRAVIFDFGGVIMKTVDYTPRHTWDTRLGLSPGSVERVVHGSESWRQAQTGHMTLEAYWQDVAAQLRLSADDLAQLRTDYFSGDALDENLLTYIRQLRESGYTVALLSNDSPELLQKLHDLRIQTLFEPIVISGSIGHMKPAPEAYQAVLTLLARPPHETIFIDDMPVNIAAAAALGIQAVRYTPEMDLPEALAPMLDF